MEFSYSSARFTAIFSTFALVSALAVGCAEPAAPPATETEPAATEPAAAAADAVERGRYLVTVMDCNGCHTPFTDKGEPDMTRMLMGHPQDVTVTTAPRLPIDNTWLVAISTTNTAWAGPWGISFTTNLTPDRTTGMGAWTEQAFINAIRQGKKGGIGRDLLPPMPWRMYANLTDDDLKAMFAYLKTIPPIQNRVPNAIPPAGYAPAAGE